MTQGRFDEALKHSTRALQLLPNTAAAYYHVGVDLLFLDDDAQTERFLTTAATRFPTSTRLQMLLAYLDLRRAQPKAALDRIRRAVDADPNNIEGLFTRAEIATLSGAADAPALVRSLVAGNANGLFGVAPYTITLVHAYHLNAGGSAAEAAKLMDEILVENRKAVTGGADWPMVFMQNAAVYALRGESTATLDWLDRAYAAGWRDGRTLAIDPLFASVRKEPRFAQLLLRIQADVAAMRARADYGGL
jgi:tetratricopeptide (TPR) repeat protein